MKTATVRFGYFLICIALCNPLLPAALAVNNFVPIKLPNGVRIELPRNWEVLSKNQRITLDSALQARNERLGLFDASSDLNFAANYYNDAGKTDALVNVRYYPDAKLTQSETRALQPSDLIELDKISREELLKSAQNFNFKILEWRGLKKQTINKVEALIVEYKRTPANNNEDTVVRLVKIYNAGKSFTLTVSYKASQELLLRPICDRIIRTLRIY